MLKIDHFVVVLSYCLNLKFFFLCKGRVHSIELSLMDLDSGAGSGSISQRYGSVDLDPDPHQNVTDPLQTEQYVKYFEQ